MTAVMIVICGPNGAGKTTLYDRVIKLNVAAIPFINADILQKEQLGDGPEKSYEAARIASVQRDFCLRNGISFITETVFSHPSKLDLIKSARDAGFAVVVYHVCVSSADLSVERVRLRVEEGGHPVPEDKVRERYVRNQELIRQAILAADRGYVYDNSALNEVHRRLISFRNGAPTMHVPDLPDWLTPLYGAPSGPS